MFPLSTKTFPSSAEALEGLLNETLHALFLTKTDPATVRAAVYPHLNEVNISLDGATLRENPPAPPAVSSATTPALEIDSMKINGAGLSAGPAQLDLSLSARSVALQQAPDSSGNIVLVLHRAADGAIALSTSVSDLETAIAEVAKIEAGKQGVAIDDVQLSLRSKSSRSLAAEVRLRARKSFLGAAIRITGQLDLDEQLNAKISGLDCLGDGVMAGVACGLLKPHLQKLNGRSFPLMSLPLGEVRLRDVQLAVGERLSVTAEFGSAAA
jgi:hypothetical protein